MKGKATSSKDKAKVIEEKLINPDSSLRDIEEKTGVNYRTSARILDKDLSQVVTSSETIAKMIDDNNRILALTGTLLLEKLENGESVRIDDIIKSRDLALKQNKLVEVTLDNKNEYIVKFEI